MIINGLEFPFSALNADDLDRLETAQEHMKQADAIERHRAKTGLADAIRGQCRLVMGFLDELLGEGASARLGLTGSDFKACQQVVSEIHDRIAEEQAELQAQPTNREQRRAAAKAQQRTRTAGRIVNNQPVSFPQPAAARMVERVDKARHGNPRRRRAQAGRRPRRRGRPEGRPGGHAAAGRLRPEDRSGAPCLTC